MTTTEKPTAESSESANADTLVRAHERLVASGERGVAISAMLSIGALAPPTGKAN